MSTFFTDLHLVDPSPAVCIDGRLVIGYGPSPYAGAAHCTLTFGSKDSLAKLHEWLEQAMQAVGVEIAKAERVAAEAKGAEIHAAIEAGATR